VIALDLLLGEKGASTKSVTERSAVLSHRQRNVSYLAAIKEADRIYDSRSKYVHVGKNPDESLNPVVQRICREITFCLLRMQREPTNRDVGFLERWLKNVDYVGAAFLAGKTLADAELRAIGIPCAGEKLLSDLEALLKERAPSSSFWTRL
jgi:hypothetical protein